MVVFFFLLNKTSAKITTEQFNCANVISSGGARAERLLIYFLKCSKRYFKPAFLGNLSAAQKKVVTKKSPYTNIRTTEQLYNRTIVAIVAIVAIKRDTCDKTGPAIPVPFYFLKSLQRYTAYKESAKVKVKSLQK